MVNDDLFIYTGKELLWEFWQDYKDFADGETNFENFAFCLKHIEADKRYKTNSELSYIEEVE